MRKLTHLTLLLLLTTSCIIPIRSAPVSPKSPPKSQATMTQQNKPLQPDIIEVVSSGNKVKLADLLMPEHPSVFLFFKPNSTLERSFVNKIQQDVHGTVGFFGVQLKTGNEPIAKQYSIQETPTAIIYDRRGHIVGRSSDADEIATLVHQAARVMRIDWAEEGDPRLEAAREMMGGQKQIPGILRTMTLQPEYLQGFMMLSMKAQFSDGFLDRRTKEMIATHVSALNKCKY